MVGLVYALDAGFQGPPLTHARKHVAELVVSSGHFGTVLGAAPHERVQHLNLDPLGKGCRRLPAAGDGEPGFVDAL